MVKITIKPEEVREYFAKLCQSDPDFATQVQKIGDDLRRAAQSEIRAIEDSGRFTAEDFSLTVF